MNGLRLGYGYNSFYSTDKTRIILVHVCVCVFFPFILDIKFVGRTSQGHTGGRSHRFSHPPSFCGACLNFCMGTLKTGTINGNSHLLKATASCHGSHLSSTVPSTSSSKVHSGHEVRWTYQPESHMISHPPSFCGACLNFCMGTLKTGTINGNSHLLKATASCHGSHLPSTVPSTSSNKELLYSVYMVTHIYHSKSDGSTG